MVMTDERLALTIPEVAKLLGMSERTAYEAARLGRIPAIRVGGRWLVPKTQLERFLNGAPME
jgi:excisionase family DNA binding protein